jgi:hypothetical protein
MAKTAFLTDIPHSIGHHGPTTSSPVGRRPNPSFASVMIAFDDAEQTQFNTYFPIMKAAGFRGVVFAIVTLVGAGAPYMTWANIQTLRANGWCIESHGYIGSVLSTLTEAEAEVELRESKRYLEEQIQSRVDCFGYPGAIIAWQDLVRDIYNWDSNSGVWPNINWNIQDEFAECYFPAVATYVLVVNTAIARAIATGECVLLRFHSDLSAAEFQWCVDTIKASGLPVITFDDVVKYTGRMPRASRHMYLRNNNPPSRFYNAAAIAGNLDYVSVLDVPCAGSIFDTAQAPYAVNDQFYLAFRVHKSITVNRIGYCVWAQAGNIDLGIYSWAGTRLVSTGQFACPAGGIQSAVIASTKLSPGFYYFGIAFDSAGTSLRGCTIYDSAGCERAAAAGAVLPDVKPATASMAKCPWFSAFLV